MHWNNHVFRFTGINVYMFTGFNVYRFGAIIGHRCTGITMYLDSLE